MVAIQTDGLTKQFGDDVLAVDNLDLTISEGEIFGFLGPNGAGKSTTINLLLDFIRPTSGTAHVLGMDVSEQSEQIRERTGVLPEGYAVYDHLTGREHIEWAIETKRTDDDPDAVLSEVGLAEDGDRTAGGYSKGMQQRLALGIALVGNPELLVLDEPSTGLDPNGIQQMRELLRDRADQGTTVFFSSHILGEVEAVCDRIGIMNDGTLAAVDTLEGLRDNVGGIATIELECGSIPESLDPGSVDGVVDSTVDDGTLTVECEDPGVKADVVEYVNGRTNVEDVLSTDTSLEELFNAYTAGGRDRSTEGKDAPEAEVPI
jgi:ABC-2 type transport system ATP-binding protein